MINFLEIKLEQIERQLKQTQASYEQLHFDYSALQTKLNMSREKYKRAALLMSEFLSDILSDRNNILTDASTIMPMSEIEVNLEKVRETPIEELDLEDKRQLVYLLLKQI